MNKIASEKDVVMGMTLLNCFSMILATIMMRYMVAHTHIVHTVLELCLYSQANTRKAMLKGWRDRTIG